VTEALSKAQRIPIGFWIESPKGAQWVNQGMTRLVGFIIEGAALGRRYIFRVCVTDDIRDEAEQDLATLAAEKDVDYTIHSPRDAAMVADDFDDLADFANRHVPVDGWISIFPNQLSAGYLNAPVSVIFPDAIALDYNDFSDTGWARQGHHVLWRERVAKHIKKANNIITFSHHVAHDQVTKHFGVAPDRIRIIKHAPPTLEGILPFIRNGRRTPESRFRAAELLRRHAAHQGWTYLVNFPFEHVRYIAVSTQDRVTKNIRIVADAVERLVRQRGEDYKAFITAQIHLGKQSTPLPTMIARSQIHLDVVPMPDLPRDVHAAFYHCAEMTIHPSVFEGGSGAFPYYESISVGRPCLMADGPHVREFLCEAPELAEFVFDPHDANALADNIVAISANIQSAIDLQASTYARLRQRSWADVAQQYARAALESFNPRIDV
jgi:hypothetical protein